MNPIRSFRLLLNKYAFAITMAFAYLLVLVGSVAAAPGDARPDAGATPAEAGDGWLTYSNDAGFSIQYPPAWVAEPIAPSAGDTYQTVVVTGTEGAVWLAWGAGFGGACPGGYDTVQLAQGATDTCYSMAPDGTESWTQIYHDLDNASFGAWAQTFIPGQESHDLVLQVLSTLAFFDAEAAATTEITPAMLIAPGALMGPVPSNFQWNPVAPQMIYVQPENGQDILWLYDARTREQRELLDPSTQPDTIDITTANWSPLGDVALLTGEQSSGCWMWRPATSGHWPLPIAPRPLWISRRTVRRFPTHRTTTFS
ncbi:MAG: hypothetical protein IPK16_16475 [Anaerolineales bacterium]|nr:hypothetical protein [Anaerolineales bacterium]